jgi:class 3 adenylate cyclase
VDIAASPRRTTMLEHTQPLACRGVILNGYLLLIGNFSQHARELSDELGPLGGTDAHFFELMRASFQKIQALHRGKLQMHEALRGEPEDLKLLTRLRSHLDALRTQVIEPLDPGGSPSVPAVGQLREIGQRAERICRAAAADRRLAQQRYADALSVFTRVETVRYAVVSVDMVEYSKFARERQLHEGAPGLFTFNESIQSRIEAAMRRVKADPGTIPAYNTGDGALFFCRAGAEQAVGFAQAFQLEAAETNRAAVAQGGASRRFRIGITTGDVSLQLKLNPSGGIWGFAAAGVAIIDAVRIQAACAPGGVYVDATTHAALPPARQAGFKRGAQAEAKIHERVTLEVYVWTPE